MKTKAVLAALLAISASGCVNPGASGFGLHKINYVRDRTYAPYTTPVAVTPSNAQTNQVDGSDAPPVAVIPPNITADKCAFTDQGGQEFSGLTGNLNPCSDNFTLGVQDLKAFQGQQIGANVALAQIAANQQLYANLIAQGKVLGGLGACAALVASGVAIPAAVLSGICAAPLVNAGNLGGVVEPEPPPALFKQGRVPGRPASASVQAQLDALRSQQQEILKRLDQMTAHKSGYDAVVYDPDAVCQTIEDVWHYNSLGYARKLLSKCGSDPFAVVNYVTGHGTRRSTSLKSWRGWVNS